MPLTMVKHRNITLRTAANPSGDSISDAFYKLDRSLADLHAVVHTTSLPPGTYTSIIVDETGRLSAGRMLTASDINTALAQVPADLSLKASVSITPHALAGTAGSTRALLTLTDGTDPHNILHLLQIRHTERSAGVAPGGWDTVTTRIEMKSDHVGQGWIDFNPIHAPGSVLIGASDGLATRRRNPSLLVSHDGITVAGSILPNQSGAQIGTGSHRFAAIHADHLHGHADTAARLAAPVKLTLTGDATGSVQFDGTAGATAGQAVQLRLRLAPVVSPGTYSRVVVDATGRVVDGGPLGREEIIAASQRPGMVATAMRVYMARADAMGMVQVTHHIANALGAIIAACGLYHHGGTLAAMTLVAIDPLCVRLTGAPADAPVRVMLTVLDHPMDWPVNGSPMAGSTDRIDHADV